MLFLSLIAVYYYLRFSRTFLFPGYESFQMLRAIEYKYSILIVLGIVIQLYSFIFFSDFMLLLLNIML